MIHASGLWSFIIVFLVFFILYGLKIVKEYQRGVKFTLGKYSIIARFASVTL